MLFMYANVPLQSIVTYMQLAILKRVTMWCGQIFVCGSTFSHPII